MICSRCAGHLSHRWGYRLYVHDVLLDTFRTAGAEEIAIRRSLLQCENGTRRVATTMNVRGAMNCATPSPRPLKSWLKTTPTM